MEAIWQADWASLLAAEGVAAGTAAEVALAGVIVAELTLHPWTLVDYALTRLICPECGEELGGGPRACAACAQAFGTLWAPELEAGATMDEHAIRVGRLVARHSWRYSPAIAAGWRFSLPFLLLRQLPTTSQAQRLAAWLKAGGDPQHLADARSYTEVCARFVAS